MKVEVRKPSQEQVAAVTAQMQRDIVARERLKQLRQAAGEAPLVVEREIDGETWYIKRLSWPEMTRVKLAIPRDDKGVLNLSQEDHLRGITIAMLVTAVVTDAEGKTTYFSNAVACEWVDDPAAIGLVSKLFNEITNVNPDILPNSKAGDSQKSPAKQPQE